MSDLIKSSERVTKVSIIIRNIQSRPMALKVNLRELKSNKEKYKTIELMKLKDNPWVLMFLAAIQVRIMELRIV